MKNNWYLFLLGGVVCLLPQALTFSESLREASDFRNSWVMMSLGLFALSSVGIVLGLFARWQTAGGLAGLVLVGVLGAVGFAKLSGSITARADRYERQHAVRALYPDMARMCLGEGGGIATAPAYDPSQNREHPTLSFKLDSYRTPNSASPEYSLPYANWTGPSDRLPELVLCRTQRETAVGQCRYTLGTATKLQRSVSFRLVAVATGSLVHEASASGPANAPCPETASFLSGSTTTTVSTGYITDKSLLTELKPFIEGH